MSENINSRETYQNLPEDSFIRKLRIPDKSREILVDLKQGRFPISMDGILYANPKLKVTDLPGCKMRFVKR